MSGLNSLKGSKSPLHADLNSELAIYFLPLKIDVLLPQSCLKESSPTLVSSRARVLRIAKILRILKIVRILKAVKVVE
jgi:hypothetical protein